VEDVNYFSIETYKKKEKGRKGGIKREKTGENMHSFCGGLYRGHF
jgi:hypothetical protein